MGAFIPVKVEEPTSDQSYSEELDAFVKELEEDSSLTLSRFCSSRNIPYQGFRSYLEQNNVNLKSLRGGRRSGRPASAQELSGVVIRMPNRIEIVLPPVTPSQLSDLLSAL